MKIKLTAMTVASALIITGWYLIFTLKNRSQARADVIVVDFDPICDEAIYLENGASEEIIENIERALLQKEPQAPIVSPKEQFLSISDGETLHSILRPHKVSEKEIASLGLALRPYLRAKDLAAGDLYRFSLIKIDEHSSLVEEFIIRKLDSLRVPILYHAKRENRDIDAAKFSIALDEPEIKEELALIQLEVSGTLYQTFNQISFGNELMQRLMSIFGWHMRMPDEVIPGDQIELLVQKKYAEGDFIGYGAIKSVNYRQKARTLFAALFMSKDKKIRGFFDENGRSLEKEFLSSPVFETTATSNQMWRKHPILKARIKHNGVDYRGTIGTDFFTIADGEVVEMRYDRNVGNMIRIRHKYGVHSEYFHANSLEDKLHVGSLVKRGQKIGTIGRTGRLCTGPHLHMGLYRLKGEKRHYLELSSLRKILQSAPNIAPSHLLEFKEHVAGLMAQMQKQGQPAVAESGRK